VAIVKKKLLKTWSVRDLIKTIADKNRELAYLNRQCDELKEEQKELIARLRRIMNHDEKF